MTRYSSAGDDAPSIIRFTRCQNDPWAAVSDWSGACTCTRSVCGGLEVPGDVAVRERAPDRRRRAEAHAPGGVVDRVGILGPGRI